jgi:CheY-like chemotaxis protein
VLTDLHMPRLDGYELAVGIRRHEADRKPDDRRDTDRGAQRNELSAGAPLSRSARNPRCEQLRREARRK